MSGKRSYDDGCASAHALELIGERWALLIVRELVLGPRRFTDLRHALPGVSPNVLAQRLHDLEEASIVVRRKLPPPASARVYALTAWGAELEPLIRELGRWAARSPRFPQGRPISATSLVLSFRTMFDAAAGDGFETVIDLRLSGQPFVVAVTGGRLEIEPGEATTAAVRVDTEPNTLAEVVYTGRDLEDALGAGDIRVEGDVAALARFVTLFPLPDTAPDTGETAAVES